VVCGNEILNRNTKYCSDECEHLRKNERRIVPHHNKECKKCGEPFTGPGRQEYCSSKCKRIAQKKRNQLGISVISDIKICIICGRKYSGRNNKYCSRTCFLNRNFRTEPNGMVLKKCTQCGEFKPANTDNFSRNKNTIHGWASICKQCSTEKHKQWQATGHAKKLRAEERIRNIETVRKYNKKMAPKRRKAEAIRRRTDIAFALKNRMRSLIYSSLRGNKNGHSLQELTGYTVEDLRQHIGKQFKDGMSWRRFLDGEIHIDHKIPVSVFNFSSPKHIDFKRCWALSNLQPLWAADNISKYDKLEKPFQPSMF